MFGGIPMYVDFDCEASDNLSNMESNFKNWRDAADVQGGFLWNYNSEARNVNEWATAINRIFPTKTVEKTAARFYQDVSHGVISYQCLKVLSAGLKCHYGRIVSHCRRSLSSIRSMA